MRLAAASLALGLALTGAASAEPRAHSGFSRVSASAGTRVEVTVGEFAVDVSGRDAQRIATRVVNGTLIVEPVRNIGFSWGRREALVRVSMPRIEGLEASSGAAIRGEGVSGPAIALEASSGAELVIAGECASFSADASSGANIRAAGLRCENGSVEVSSGASVHVFASGRLDVEASSGGDVVAHGNPGIGDIDLSSGGSLRRAS